MQELFADRPRLLVAGAGGGREVISLARMGHRVIGFDPSRDLVDACIDNVRMAGVEADIYHAEPGEVPTDMPLQDGLVIGRGVYHHISGRHQRIDFLRACRAQLKAQAPLFLGDFLLRKVEAHRLTGLSPFPSVERGDTIGSAFYHYFAAQEVVDELQAADFDVMAVRATPFPGSERRLAHVLARAGRTRTGADTDAEPRAGHLENRI